MSVTGIYSLGTTKRKLSVFSNLNDYVRSTDNTILRNITDSRVLFSITGEDYSDFFLSCTENKEYDLFLFKDGSKIIFNKTTDNNNWWGDNLFFMYSRRGNIIHISQDGTRTIMLSGDWTYQITKDNETKKTPIYFLLGMDDDLKYAYFIRILNNPLYGNGTFTGFGTNISVIGGTNTSIYARNYVFFSGNGTEYDSDPWSNAGYSDIGGGEGSFNFESDIIALPSLPTVDAVSSGFLQLFSGGLSSILELSKYMWSSSFFDSVVKITSNPIDIIMGLYMYPFIVPAANQKYIRAGNVITNVVMNVPDSQIIEIDCGNVEVPNFYGAYLDYEPFTKCDLFLPYCGTFPLSMDDIAGKTLTIKYRVDLLTGVCGAYVIIDESVKYNYTGTCAINVPISSRSFENLYNSIMGVVGSMIGGSSFGLPSVGSVAGAVTSGKNQIQHGGNCSGNAGYLGVQKPYLIFSVPNVAIPKGLNTYTGYPIFATYKLSDLKGYTEVEEIHLENMGNATKEEITMIINRLEEGVIL